MSLDLRRPLLDNTYYETTLKFLLVEYYKCVKNQNELIDSIPIDFKRDDEMVILTMYLLYGNAYAKKRIFKEILDLVLYNASFLISLKVDALVEEDMKKNYDSSKLKPTPQVEELTGGGNIVFLQALMFLSFMVLYNALSDESQLTVSNYQTHDVEFSDEPQLTVSNSQSHNVDVDSNGNIGATIKFIPRNYDEIIPSYENLSKGINKRDDDFVFSAKNPVHMKSYVQRYGDFTIGENSQLTKFIGENMDRKLPFLQRYFGKNEYIKTEIDAINPFIIDLFRELEKTCLQVVEKREDQLPLELEKKFNSTLINISKNSDLKLKEAMKTITPAITQMAKNELSDKGLNPEVRSSQINNMGTPIDIEPVIINVKSRGTYTNEELKNMEDEIKNKLTNEAKQKILKENMEQATKSALDEAAELLNESNKRSFFNSACRKWFGTVPQFEYNEENQTLSISDSAESFSSLKIILENIIHFADKVVVPKGNENERKILIQKSKFLNAFIDDYNVLIYNILDNNQKFGSIQVFTSELRKLVNKLYNEVKFIYENSFPDDAIKTYDKIQSENELKQLESDEASARAERNTQTFSNTANVLGSFTKGATRVLLDPILDAAEMGANKVTDTAANVGKRGIEKAGEVVDTAGDVLSNMVYKYMIPGGFALVGALVTYVTFMYTKLYFAKEHAKLSLGYNQNIPQQLQPGYQQMPQLQQGQQFQPGYQQMPPGYQQMPPGYQQMPSGYQQMPSGYQQMPQLQQGQQFQPGYQQMPQLQQGQQFQVNPQRLQNNQGQNQQVNSHLSDDDVFGGGLGSKFGSQINKGGKKTRKHTKKTTRKLKRGKRRQTRHRNGRKTKRR